MANLHLEVITPKAVQPTSDEINTFTEIPAFLQVTVGPSKYAAMDVDTWIKIRPIPINRNSHNRVSKMKKIFDEATLQNTQPLTEVAMGLVTQDFSDVTDFGDGKAVKILYRKGEVYRLDGNTRAYYWKKYPEQAEGVNLSVRVIELTCAEDVKVYYTFDSQEAVEKANEKIQGLKNKYQWYPNQAMFNNGQFKTALDWAYPDEDPQKMEVTFHYFFDALKTLDKIGSPDGPWVSKPAHKAIAKQAIYAALLIALKDRGNDARVLDLIQKLINVTEDELATADNDDPKSTFTIPQVIVAEYSGYSYYTFKKNGARGPREKFEHVFNKDKQPCVGSTKRADKAPQLDFLLYMIDEYVKNPRKTFMIRKMSPSLWEGKYQEYLEDHVE